MKKLIIIGIISLFAIIVFFNCFFILNEDESALVQRFGRIEAVYMKSVSADVLTQLREDNPDLPIHTGTGLKFKIPFIDNVIKYPSKLILYDSPPREVITLDRHRLYFDNTAQWRIENPLRFYMAYNNIDSAKTRIDDVLYSEMRQSVGQMSSYVIISNREASSQMLLELAENVSRNFVQQGISVVDIRIKRTDLPVETYSSIYNRMNTERQQEAAMYRSEGEEIWLRVRSETDRRVISITSQAQRDAEIIRGEGDSEAARIYNEVYGKNPEFFEFYNLLDTYRQSVGNGSTLVIPLDSPFAKYLLGVDLDLEIPAAVQPPDGTASQNGDGDGDGNGDAYNTDAD
ncbi:MAG: protease modulator HflC [Oscillospiraceae bacterium]|nr:protease modulator HflC [Oscillospiraceae bacterium]